jgi:quercetin dioxygenase-like cupin family protein
MSIKNVTIPFSKVVQIEPKFQFIYDGAAVNIFHANKGQGLQAHNHSYSHVTMCLNGSCAIRKEGKEIIATKNTQPINLVAIEWHEIEALEDGTVFINLFAENKY